MKSQFKDGYKNGLEFLLQTRLIQRFKANVRPDREYLPDETQDFITTMITGESPAPEISILWIPPKYEKVELYPII